MGNLEPATLLNLQQLSPEFPPERKLEPLKPYNEPFKYIVVECREQEYYHQPDNYHIENQGADLKIPDLLIRGIEMSPPVL